MKVDVQGQTAIEKPVADVYTFIATEHERNHPRWDAQALEFKLLDPGPVAVGTRFAYKRRALGRSQMLELVVTEMDPDHKFAFRISGAWQARITYTFEPASSSGTALHFDGRFEVPGPQFLAPLMKVPVNREAAEGQRRIKQMVEADV